MLKYLDERISWKVLIWLSPLAFIIHDFEEILTMEPWMEKNISKLPAFIRDSASISTQQFTAAVMLLFASLLLISYFASRSQKDSTTFKLYVFISAALFINGLTHVLQAVIFRGYIPGILTAVELIPFFAYVLYRVLKEKITTMKTIIVYSLVSLVLQGVLATAAKEFGKLIA